MERIPSQETELLTASIASKTASAAAAAAFTQLTRQRSTVGDSGSDIEGLLGRAWNSIINLAANTEHASQEPLVGILRALQQQNLAKDENGSEYTVWGEKVKVWKDMPLFGPAVRDVWNRAPGTGSKDDLSTTQWCNINGFLARLTSFSSSIPLFDFSLYAIWTLRSAFESTNDVPAAEKDAAKVWFLYAEDTIDRLSREEKTFDGKIAKAGDKFKDRDWRGFNAQRMEIWQAALK